MPLHDGYYLLRIVSVDHPDPGPGGMFLTLVDYEKVKVEALGPHTFEAQKWLVRAVIGGGPNVYTIEKSIPGPPSGLREGLLEDADEIPVVFGQHPEQWRINGNEDSEVYLISPNKQYPIGVEHLVGTDGDEVVVKVFPVIPGDRPAWRFEPIKD